MVHTNTKAETNSPTASQSEASLKFDKLRTISLDDVKGHFDKPLSEAAALLGRSSSKLKQELRVLGIPRWPYRKINALKERIKVLQLKNSQSEDRRRESGSAKSTSPFELQIEELERQIEDIRHNPGIIVNSKRKKATEKAGKSSSASNSPQSPSTPPAATSTPSSASFSTAMQSAAASREVTETAPTRPQPVHMLPAGTTHHHHQQVSRSYRYPIQATSHYPQYHQYMLPQHQPIHPQMHAVPMPSHHIPYQSPMQQSMYGAPAMQQQQQQLPQHMLNYSNGGVFIPTPIRMHKNDNQQHQHQ